MLSRDKANVISPSRSPGPRLIVSSFSEHGRSEFTGCVWIKPCVCYSGKFRVALDKASALACYVPPSPETRPCTTMDQIEMESREVR